jgi:hypothetical protein
MTLFAAEKEMYPEVRVKENESLKILDYSLADSITQRHGIDTTSLSVRILFKEHCIASKKKSRFEEIVNNPNASSAEIGEAFGEAFGETINNMSIYVVPFYQCKPKMKVFLTTYDYKGNEVSTYGQYVIAPSQTNEIFPGEITKIDFLIIERSGINLDDPIFQIWLPK